ncbi:hypothetical protein D3C72_2042590 [compost metagenome]
MGRRAAIADGPQHVGQRLGKNGAGNGRVAGAAFDGLFFSRILRAAGFFKLANTPLVIISADIAFNLHVGDSAFKS